MRAEIRPAAPVAAIKLHLLPAIAGILCEMSASGQKRPACPLSAITGHQPMPTLFVVRRLRPVKSNCTQTGKLRLMEPVHDATGTMLMIYEPTREDGEN